MKHKHVAERIGWSQLLTEGMTPEVAAVIMGVPAGIAECELRRSASEMSETHRQADKVALFLQSSFPTIEPRVQPRLI